LKGTFDLDVEIEEAWEAASNGAIVEIQHFPKTGLKKVQFEVTKPISPYLWTVNVGTFRVSSYFDGGVP
jgi:aminopeptidase N